MREAGVRPRRIAVTGGAGAIGRQVVQRLLAAGVERVRVIDPQAAAGADPRIEASTASIFDLAALATFVSGCDAVVHLAAVTVADACARNPVACFGTNVGGTVAVLDASRGARVSHVVFVSTAYVYGRRDAKPVGESAPRRPDSEYAASKAAAEVAVEAWARHGPQGTIVRLSNVYGPGTSAATVLHGAIDQALATGTIRVRSFAPVRDFLLIDDAAEAIVRLTLAGPPPQPNYVVNVGTGVGHSVGSALAVLREVLLERGLACAVPVEAAEDTRDGTAALVLDVSRLRSRTGWQPKTDLLTGLRRTVDAALTHSSPSR